MNTKLPYSLIHKYLLENDTQFNPNLSKTVNILEYSRKIAKFAEHFTIIDKNCIIGFAAVYMNDVSSQIAYLTYINIGREEQGKGYGKKMLEEIINLAKNRDYFFLKLEVSKKNVGAILFYKKNNFKIIEENETSFFMIKEI